MDPQNTRYNPGLRQVAKILLNYMCGKFGQQLNRTQVKEFVDEVAFREFLDSTTATSFICMTVTKYYSIAKAIRIKLLIPF